MQTIPLFRQPHERSSQNLKSNKMKKNLLFILCLFSLNIFFTNAVSAQCDDPPTITCAEFAMTYDDCPDGLGPNTPNGVWTPIGPTGGINNAVGGSYGLFLDLSTCVTDDCTSLAAMEYTLAASYSEDVVPGCSITLVNEWSIRDSSGNVSPDIVVFKGTIAFNGTAAPVIVCPANVGVECGESIDPMDTGEATATSDCGTPEITFADVLAPACGTTGIITRTWTATDGCGLTSTCEQIITTFDTQAPVLPMAPAPVTVECDAIPMPEMLMADDACAGMVMGVVADVVTDGACDNSYTITRTWTFADDCGNSDELSQIITVEDTTPPEVTCAEFTMTFDRCPDPLGPNTPSGNWITVPATGIFQTAVGGSSIGTIDLNGCVTDNCSDFASGGFEYMVSDSYEENRVPGCSVDIINEFMIRDICGNVSPTTFIFRGMIQFGGPGPVITCPDGDIVECAAEITVSPMDATATSDCGNPAVTITGPVVDGDADCPGTTYTYTYTATDGCGRTASCDQVFTIENDPPVIVCPMGMIVECSADIVVDPADAAVTTSCTLGFNTVITGPVQVGDDDCPGTTYTYTYTTTDDCGRTVSCDQVFTIENDPPVIVCPMDMIVECSADIVVDPADATVTTSCTLGFSAVVVTGPVQVGDDDCPGTTYTYTYTTTDDCGRTVSCDQVFTIENDPPTIVCPANMIVECFVDIAVDPADAVVTTSCTLGSNTVITGPVQVGADDCPGTTYTYTYTTTDDCGRTASCEQVFTIQNLAPIITCPADEVVTCFEDIVADPSNLTVITACGMDFFVYVKQPLITGGIPGCDGTVYTYIYKVTDACGRVSECQQQFLIQNDAPTVTVPAGGTVECFSDIVVSTADATVVADCEGDFVINVLGPVLSGPANCPGTTYTYTYRVKDFCNRTVEVDRVFTIGNNAAPVITSVIETQTTTCLAGVNPNENFITYETSCGDAATVNIAGPQIIGAMDCNGTRYRYTYTVTDACGRNSAAVVLDYVVQNEGPVFAGCEDEQWLQFNCEDYGGEEGTIAAIEAYIASVSATSACDSDLTVFNNFNSNNINTCINNGINTITFRATDNCGRTSFCTTTYVVTDTEAPTIFEEAQDHWEICNYDTPSNFDDWVDSYGGAAAYDACSNDNVFWSTIPSNPSFNCDGAMGVTSVTVTFRVRDNCGNVSTTTATFNAFMGGGDIDSQGNEYELGEDNSSETNLDLTSQDVNGVVAGEAFTLYQNQPNPFKEATVIGFSIPEAGVVSLRIYDMSGRLVHNQNGDFAKGFNQFDLNGADLPSGILYYQVNTATDSDSKKMILLD